MKIGWGELLIILIVALVIVGPDKLPEAGRSLGWAIRGVRKYVRDTAEEMDLSEEIKEARKDVEDIRSDIRSFEKSVGDFDLGDGTDKDNK